MRVLVHNFFWFQKVSPRSVRLLKSFGHIAPPSPRGWIRTPSFPPPGRGPAPIVLKGPARFRWRHGMARGGGRHPAPPRKDRFAAPVFWGVGACRCRGPRRGRVQGDQMLLVPPRGRLCPREGGGSESYALRAPRTPIQDRSQPGATPEAWLRPSSPWAQRRAQWTSSPATSPPPGAAGSGPGPPRCAPQPPPPTPFYTLHQQLFRSAGLLQSNHAA